MISHFAPYKYLLLPIIVGLIILSFGKLPFLNAHHGHDQGGYMYMGKAISEGMVPYRDLWDHKNPGLSYIHSVAYTLGADSIVTFRVIEFIWTVLTFLLFIAVLTRLYKTGPPVAIGLSILYFALILAHVDFATVDGGGYTESFLTLPNLLAVFLLLIYEKTKHPLLPLGIGVLLFASFMLKQSGVLLVLPVLYFLAAVWWKDRHQWRTSLRPIFKAWAFLSLGFFVPLVLLLWYFYAAGALPAYIDNTILFNKLYASGTTVLTKFLGSIYIAHQYTLGFPVTYFLFAAGIVTLLIRRNVYSYLLIGWFITDMIGITSTNKFYGHYYVQLFPVLSLIAGAGIISLTEASKTFLKEHRSIFIVILVPLFFLLFIPYISNPAMAYINKWSELRRHVMTENTTNVTPEILTYVDEHTDPNDTIYIWSSNQIYIYLRTDTWSASPYFHAIPFSATHAPGYATDDRWKELKQDLKEKKPKLILVNEASVKGIRDNPIVWEYITSHYTLGITIDDANGTTEIYLPNEAL